MNTARLVAAALVLVPRVADACASCLSSPYGDRAFNWAYLGLFAMPFALAAVVGGVLARCYFSSRREGDARTDSTVDEERT